MSNQFSRIERLIGKDAIDRLSEKTVAIAGVGAVGGFAIEALARSGVGRLRILDFDTVSESNINRQIIAMHSTLGRLKTEVMKERLLDINPNIIVEDIPQVLSEENHSAFFKDVDLVLDCIDSVDAKVALLAAAYRNNIPIISSMGAALRRNPKLITTGDIMDSKGCPLAKKVRSMLRKEGIGRGIKCVYSTENVVFEYIKADEDEEAEITADRNRKHLVLGSLPTITAIFGEMMAHLALNQLLDGILEKQ